MSRGVAEHAEKFFIISFSPRAPRLRVKKLLAYQFDLVEIRDRRMPMPWLDGGIAGPGGQGGRQSGIARRRVRPRYRCKTEFRSAAFPSGRRSSHSWPARASDRAWCRNNRANKRSNRRTAYAQITTPARPRCRRKRSARLPGLGPGLYAEADVGEHFREELTAQIALSPYLPLKLFEARGLDVAVHQLGQVIPQSPLLVRR